MFDERGEPTDAQYLEWNEANDANDDGRAVADAERADAEADTHLGYNPEIYQLDLSALIDAYASACIENAQAAFVMDTEGELAASQAETAIKTELDRRIRLAQNDSPVMWKSHLDNTVNSRLRQRSLLEQIERHRQSTPHLGPWSDLAEMCRVWPLDTPEETK